MNSDVLIPKWSRLGIVAGGGALPMVLAKAAKQSDVEVHIARIKGFADQNWDGFPSKAFEREDIAAIGDYFRACGVQTISFAGQVQRPDFTHFSPRKITKSAKDDLSHAARQGDDSLLRSVMAIFEKAGFVVVGAGEIAPQFLAPQGIIGTHDIADAMRSDCRHAFNIAQKMGSLDIGQGAVVCDGIVLAVEAQEGTASMLERCATLPEAIIGTPGQRRGVFAKCAKPMQDKRIDLPVIGVSTVESVAKAGLAGLVLEAGAVIILEPEAVRAAADRLDLFIYGATTGSEREHDQEQ